MRMTRSLDDKAAEPQADRVGGPILVVRDLTKVYATAHGELKVLDGVSFSLEPSATVAIVGPSGSGKSTLLALCAGLDAATEGTVVLDGTSLEALSEDERAVFRNRHVGFVFQNFQLIPTLTALENVMVPLELRGRAPARSRAAELLGRVGLGDRVDHYPVQLSGGEQQRVAIARAFATGPRVLFADEPTGNLDHDTSVQIADLLFELNHAAGTTLVLVTHDAELAARAGRVLRLRRGRLEGPES